MEERKWRRIESRPAGHFGIFSVRYDRSRSPVSGYEREYTVLEAVDWVNVVAVTPEGRFVLVRQYRHGTGEYTVEIAGGGVDRGESPEAAARRELEEETGYVTEDWDLLGVVEPNPAFQANLCHTYLARNVRPDGKPAPDPGEEIDVLAWDATEVQEAVRRGVIRHALVIAAFFWYDKWSGRA
ncbi:MAG: NUDIX hydrolase [Gemmatimonadetes bacterium]|nr:NUDIX hydrolase [Gemmatimonadota bacterium]